MTYGENGVEARALQIAADLQVRIGAIVEGAVGTTPRPATLSKRMGLSPSLAARVMRSIRADHPAGVFKDIPAPKGLAMLVVAAGKMGVDDKILRDAERSVDNFERLINEFPAGRAGLHAAMAGVDQSTRDRTTRDAVQNVFRSMTLLLGYHAEQHVHTAVLVPSRDDSDRIDIGLLLFKTGICRYRPSSRITVFGQRINSTEYERSNPRVQTLSGVEDSSDPADYMLAEHCSSNVDRIELFKNRDLCLFILPSDEPPLGEAMNYCGACLVRNGSVRYATENKKWQWESVVPRIPARNLTINLLVHNSIAWSREPVLTSSLHGLNATWERPDDPALEVDHVDNRAELKRLDSVHPGSMAVRGVPRYFDALSTVVASLDAGLDEFRAYGVSAPYPVPLIAQTIWYPLSEK